MLHFNIALYHLFSLDARIVSLPASAFNLGTTETFTVYILALKLYLPHCLVVADCKVVCVGHR